MNFQTVMSISFVSVLIFATSTIALGDDSELIQTLSGSKLLDNSLTESHGHIKDILWVKKVSSEGVIEIKGITFSVFNNDEKPHFFEICAVIEGPLGEFTPQLDSSPACTSLEMIEGIKKMENLSIDFSKGVKVSDMIDISMIIQEI